MSFTSSVKSYSDGQILDRVKGLPSFISIPQVFWLIGVRSTEDLYNQFDDKAYLFKGETFKGVYKFTTNAGTDLLNPSNPKGEAVLKSDEIYYNAWERRLHRGKVMAYCQRVPLPIYRDNDRDRNIEELGTPVKENVGINIHPASYQIGSKIEKQFIEGWSAGCQVFAQRSDFDEFMKLTEGQQQLTYALLKEW